MADAQQNCTKNWYTQKNVSSFWSVCHALNFAGTSIQGRLDEFYFGTNTGTRIIFWYQFLERLSWA